MKRGFTLAELLIALAILGVIATFTIPKVLQGQQNQKFNSIAKEAAGTIAQAYQAYRLEHQTVSTAFSGVDLSPYFNYVSIDTVSLIDHVPTNTSLQCASAVPCYRLHNGAVLQPYSHTMGGTNNDNAVLIRLDPDGVYSGSTNGNGKTIQFFLYYNGKIMSNGTLDPTAVSSDMPRSANPAYDPAWFSWDN